MVNTGLMHYGSIEFKKKSWEEQAKPEGHENADLAGYMFGFTWSNQGQFWIFKVW